MTEDIETILMCDMSTSICTIKCPIYEKCTESIYQQLQNYSTDSQ